MLKFSDNIRAKQMLHGRAPQPQAEANPKSVSSNTSQANASRIPVKEAEIHTKIAAKTREPSPVEVAKTQEKNEHKQEKVIKWSETSYGLFMFKIIDRGTSDKMERQ